MKKSVTLLSGLLVLLALLVGCSTMGDVVKAKDEGTSKVYPVNAEQAWIDSKGGLSLGGGRCNRGA